MAKGPRYSSGTQFVVPLRTGGLVRGVLLRLGKKGVALGAFFGPVLSSMADVDPLSLSDLKQTLLVAQFGDLGLKNGEWEITGKAPETLCQRLDVSEFVRATSDGQVLVSRYDDRMNFLAERRGSQRDVEALPKDTLMGYGSVEIALTELSCARGN